MEQLKLFRAAKPASGSHSPLTWFPCWLLRNRTLLFLLWPPRACFVFLPLLPVA